MTYPPLHSLAELSRGVLAVLEKEGLRKVNVVARTTSSGKGTRPSARSCPQVVPAAAADPVASGIEVMIIDSDNDPLVEAKLRELLRDTYPSAVVHTFHGTGHFTYLSEPAQCAEVLSGFLGPAQGNPGEEGGIAPVLPQGLDPSQVVRFYDNGETREMSLADLVELVGAATQNPRACLGPGWWLSPGYAACYFTLNLLDLAWKEEDRSQCAAGEGHVISDGRGAVRGVYVGTHWRDATSESARVTLETEDEKANLIYVNPHMIFKPEAARPSAGDSLAWFRSP